MTSHALRIATYNVHACVGADGRHDPDRVAAVIGELDADVVALQEFTYPASVALDSRAPVVLTTLDRYECALGPTRNRMGRTVTECFGNALLTRHPIVEVHRIDLSMERREPRGALAATIDVAGTVWHVLATHLGLRIHERHFQTRQIMDYLNAVRDTFIVVLGDFNDWLPGRSAAHLLDRRLGHQPRPATFPVRWPIVALDRIWVHPRHALRRLSVHTSATARIASDHFPVVAEVALPQTQVAGTSGASHQDCHGRPVDVHRHHAAPGTRKDLVVYMHGRRALECHITRAPRRPRCWKTKDK